MVMLLMVGCSTPPPLGDNTAGHGLQSNLESHSGPTNAASLGDGSFTDAAAFANLPRITELIAKGVDINAKNKDGVTALLLAAQNGHLEVVNVLLEAKADPNIADADGDTALLLAVESGAAEVVQALLKAGASLQHKNTQGKTALMIANDNGLPTVIKILQDAGTAE